MPSDRKPSLVLPVAGAVLLLAGYVGTYYAMVEPRRVFNFSEGSSIIEPAFPSLATTLRARHRWATAFLPIHWLDRRIRPHVWEPKP